MVEAKDFLILAVHGRGRHDGKKGGDDEDGKGLEEKRMVMKRVGWLQPSKDEPLKRLEDAGTTFTGPSTILQEESPLAVRRSTGEGQYCLGQAAFGGF